MAPKKRRKKRQMSARLRGGATRLQIIVVLVIAAIAIALAILAINYQRGLATGVESATTASHSGFVSGSDTIRVHR